MRVLFALLLVSCSPSFDPPKAPDHGDDRGGHLHAALSEYPFLCPPPGGTKVRRATGGVRCSTVTATRTLDIQRSCDSAGCHGNYDYRTDPVTTERHLRGSNGPSCWTCHGEEWRSDR